MIPEGCEIQKIEGGNRDFSYNTSHSVVENHAGQAMNQSVNLRADLAHHHRSVLVLQYPQLRQEELQLEL